MNTRFCAAIALAASLAAATAAEAQTWTPWDSAHGGVPPNAFIAGQENIVGRPGQVRILYICQADLGLRGVHPGKVVEGSCNVGYDSKEIKWGSYQVLTNVDPRNVAWVRESNGNVPPGAFEGGRESQRTLYVCRGSYTNGVHPGKVVDHACNIAWGGREPHLQDYEVLVIRR